MFRRLAILVLLIVTLMVGYQCVELAKEKDLTLAPVEVFGADEIPEEYLTVVQPHCKYEINYVGKLDNRHKIYEVYNRDLGSIYVYVTGNGRVMNDVY